MDNKWFFSIDSTLTEDYGDHGTEVFKNNNDGAEKFKKFAREMVQNAIDVKNEKLNEPVVVTFDLIDVKKEKIPSLDGLKEHIEGTIENCKKKKKFNNAYNNSVEEMKYVNNDIFRFLKISDYNTKGITGSKDLEGINCAWTGLVYNDGDSVQKSANSLGSHGLGKGAAFAISKLRTVFYNTKDINGNKAFQGVSRQYVSYVDGVKKDYKGFFGNVNEENTIVLPLLDDEITTNYSFFKRDELGSDVFVLEPDISGMSDEMFKWYMIESVICNFFVAIRDGELEVKVNGTEITQSNIDRIMGKLNEFYEKNYLDKPNMLIETEQYIYALEHSEPIIENVKNYGEIKLWLHKDPNTKWKNVAIVRKNGMLIKPYEVRMANQKFAGVVIVNGTEGVKFLKSIEDPSHMDFDPSRATDEKLNYGTTEEKTKRLNTFYEWIRLQAKTFTKITTDNTITFSGLEDYIQMPSKEEKKYDVRKVEPKVIVIKPKPGSKPRVGKKTKVVEVDEGVQQHNPDEDIKGKGGGPNPNDKPHGGVNEDPGSKKEGIIKTYVASFEAGPVIKTNGQEAVLVFGITETDKKFKVKICAVDEEGRENNVFPEIEYAFNENTGEMLEYNWHVINGVECEGVMKIRIRFNAPIKTCLKPIVYWEEEI